MHSSDETAIHAIILTRDEAMHITRCIASIKPYCASITVVDSGSVDETCALARAAGADVVFNPWINHSTQFNHGLDLIRERGGWVLRIDADEVLEREMPDILTSLVANAPPSIDGFSLQRRIVFLGRRIRHGGVEPSWQLRLFRNGRGRVESRWMDEHIVTEGRNAQANAAITDNNLNSLSWWTTKHNAYASREAIETLNLRHGFLPRSTTTVGINRQARIKRWLKENFYLRQPALLRTTTYFLYRYVLRLGFLDGTAGFYWHALQGYWYRTLVDAKVYEIEAYAEKMGCSIPVAIKRVTGIEV